MVGLSKQTCGFFLRPTGSPMGLHVVRARFFPMLPVNLISQLDRVLKGGKPGDLPFRTSRPSSISGINLLVAKTLGIELSPAILARADEVIE